MGFNIDRRMLIKAGTFGLAALPTPVLAQFASARGFTHGVASGEPGHNSVLLWTRYVGGSEPKLTAEISATPDFAKPISGGKVTASGERDHIAKLTVSGLAPGQWYFYRFVAPDGSFSQTGRTRTLPDGPVSKFNLAVFSCSNMPFGWFNAYAHACQRSDIDLVLHLGDYFYEYAGGTYPGADQKLAGRDIEPENELVTLADYRLRYAAYRRDTDLLRLHQLYPMIAQWDDHELANDAWEGGAENHQPDSEGPWDKRRAIAERVYSEWMPVTDIVSPTDRMARYQVGNLATIIKTESRITGRSEQLDIGKAIAGKEDVAAALASFRDDVWQNPSRSMLGTRQEAWLADGLAASTAAGTRWQVWAQQCVMGEFDLPLDAAKWVPEGAPDYVLSRLRSGVAASRAGLPANLDAWDGYPAARERSLTAAREADADLIVLSGDSHNGWGFDLNVDGAPAGVEFAGHSVTSPGFESYTPGVDPKALATALRERNPSLKWTDTFHRGYLTVALTPDRADATWHHLESIKQRTTALAGEDILSVARGARKIAVG